MLISSNRPATGSAYVKLNSYLLPAIIWVIQLEVVKENIHACAYSDIVTLVLITRTQALSASCQNKIIYSDLGTNSQNNPFLPPPTPLPLPSPFYLLFLSFDKTVIF